MNHRDAQTAEELENSRETPDLQARALETNGNDIPLKES